MSETEDKEKMNELQNWFSEKKKFLQTSSSTDQERKKKQTSEKSGMKEETLYWFYRNAKPMKDCEDTVNHRVPQAGWCR